MPLFEFQLASVDDIVPWGNPGEQRLSWFALTDGWFRINVGNQILFRYSDEILSHWGRAEKDADYQIASFARDILGCVAPGLAKLPAAIERLASNWDLLIRLYKPPVTDKPFLASEDRGYKAWRWLGERSPTTSYLVAYPHFYFIRVGDDIHIHWDNRNFLINGIPAWAAQMGVHIVSAANFSGECEEFADRLLTSMDQRIAGIESGILRPQIGVNIPSLRQQHETWRAEFSSYFSEHIPDISWVETESALRGIAENVGTRLG
jgi:hypothetical protein